ncbi:MAG: hypothetical protein ACFFF4_18470 [Candidatus Thorarchaeota archaeon]
MTYTYVESHFLLDNAHDFEGIRISTTVTILSIKQSSNVSTRYSVEEDFDIVLTNEFDLLEPGTNVILRGICYIETSGFIDGEEIYVSNGMSSILRSIPGILLITLVLFRYYRFSVKKLSFIPRGEKDS